MRKICLSFLALSFVLTACNSSQSKKDIESSLLASVESSIEEESKKVEESVNQLIKEQQESESIKEQIDEAVEKALSEQAAAHAATSQAPQVQIIQVPVETTSAPKKQKQKSYASSSSVETKVKEIRAIYNTTKNGSYAESNGLMYIADGRMIRAVLDIKNQSSNSYPYASYINDTIISMLKKAGYTNAYIEFYYYNVDSGSDYGYSYNAPLTFVYMLIDGKEYRYYFNTDGSFIRRIGPEGQTDNPEANWFVNDMYNLGLTIYRNY